MMLSQLKTMDSVSLAGKHILLRADLNVPLSNCKITDNSRIVALLPTIKELLQAKAKIIIISHLGRPKSKNDTAFSLQPVCQQLQRILDVQKYPAQCQFVPDFFDPKVKEIVEKQSCNTILVFENLRFYGEEVENNTDFAKHLASFADIYINDAFSCSHRAHASITAITQYLPSVAGRLMEKEISVLQHIFLAPKRPLMAIVGGAKISTKLAVLKNLIQAVDVLVIGGAMANSFLKAQNIEIGTSLVENDMLDQTKDILTFAKQYDCEIILPEDVIVAENLHVNVISQAVSIYEIPKDAMCLDIGPKTLQNIIDKLDNIKTLLWNGPLGAFEVSPFDKASVSLALQVGLLTKKGKIQSIAGGGDTLALLSLANMQSQFSYCSMAGGAFLEWLEGKSLPGVEPLLIP